MLEGNECHGKTVKAKEIRSVKRKSFAILSRVVNIGLSEKADLSKKLKEMRRAVWRLRGTIHGRGKKDPARECSQNSSRGDQVARAEQAGVGRGNVDKRG